MINYSIEINIGNESASYSKNEAQDNEPSATKLIEICSNLLKSLGYSEDSILNGMNLYIE